MTLRCPKCGSRRVIFLSTTDGTAVGSTDQRYLCKDCGYRGSLILDDAAAGGAVPGKAAVPGERLLLVLDVALFASVLLVLLTGSAGTPLGMVLIAAWIAVFLATIVSLTVHLSQQSTEEWFQYGILLTTGVLVAMMLGIVLGFDVYGVMLIVPLAVMGVFTINWMFTDRSEEEIDRDLERLRGEMGN